MEQSGLAQLTEWLWDREGRPPGELLNQMAFADFECVLYCDLEATLGEQEITAGSLAEFDSVRRTPARNAIDYLARNIAQGIVTPLTYAYRDAILRRTGACDLAQAEKLVLASVG